jgi:hypothetical protein
MAEGWANPVPKAMNTPKIKASMPGNFAAVRSAAD